jgi:phage shock protein PspC (stress-responsive transcriptional regulator)
MKKTFTINISGSVFHIEEDAFEKLQAYLQNLNCYLGTEESGQEILQDIEARIAELLQDKINEGQEAITCEWVDEVMQRMGNPEDFMEQGKTESEGCEVKGEKIRKRLYRDGENRVLGGVCSGLSTYFNIDPVFLRILFVALVFVGVGISIFVYLILWIVVPEAKTTAQRLEMKGEEATISNIQKAFQEEVKEVKDSFSKMGRSASFQKGKEAAHKAGKASITVFSRLAKAIGVVFGSLLILTGFAGFIAFTISMAVGNSVVQGHSIGISPDVDFSGILGFVVSPGLVSAAILLVILLIGIPLLAILFIGTKLVFRYRTNNKLIGLGAFGIWLLALIALFAITAGQASNFSQRDTVSSGKPLSCPTCNTLYLELGNVAGTMDDEKNVRFDDFSLVSVNGEKEMAGNPRLQIEPTDAAEFSVIIRKHARGRNAAEVRGNLDRIEYTVNSKDSTLVLDPYFTIGKPSKWRNQEVQVTLKVPVGKSVHLGENLDRLHFAFDNINNVWNKDMTGKTWAMTPEGLSLKE